MKRPSPPRDSLCRPSSAGGNGALQIRFIHNYYHPDISAVSQVITDIAGELAARGHAVSVIASKNRYVAGTAPPLRSREVIDGVLVRRIWAPAMSKDSLVGRVFNQLSFIIGASVAAFSAARVDTVVMLTDPPLFAALGLLLKRWRGEHFVHVVMDLYPDVAIRYGLFRRNSLIGRLSRWLTGRTLRGADRVVVLGSCMRDAVLAYGARPERTVVIRNWAASSAIRPVDPVRNRFRAETRLREEEFVVMYSGNLGAAHRFDEILETARRLRGRSDIVFVFVGGGSRRGEVEAYREQHELCNIVLLPYQEQARLSESLSAANVHFVSLRRGFEGLVVPSKSYGIMAAGRPLLYEGDPSGEIAQMITRWGIGIVVSEGDADALEDAVLQLAEDPERTSRMGASARRALEGHYGRCRAMDSYESVLRPGGPGRLPRIDSPEGSCESPL